MKLARLLSLGIACVLLATVSVAAGASPLAGPCMPGASYDPACDVDHDGDVDIFDIQLTASHWNQTGTWMSDNDHNHLGQTWTGTNNPLKITGSFSISPNRAPLILGNSAPFGDGLRVDSAGADGLKVVSAGNDGVYVSSAGGSGIEVFSAGDNGVHVTSAGSDGVHVQNVDDEGFYVERAGNPSFIVSAAAGHQGLEVAGAEGVGLWVGRAEWSGVYVYSADHNGVDATSTSASYYGGMFENSASGGGGVYARGGGNTAADLILGGTGGSDDDGRLYSEPSLTDSDILLFTNDEAHVHLDEDNNSTSTFTIYNGANASVWSVGETGMAVSACPSAVQVDAGREGQRLAYAVTSPQNWIEDFGSGQLKDGEVVVALDSLYAEAVNAGQPYHVFLTPLGDCALYVAEKGETGFTVRALGGEKCNVPFDYRIVGLRRGYETVRMERYVEVSDE